MRTGALLVSVTPLDAMAGGKESKILKCLKMTFWSLPNHSRPDPGQREKINLDFSFASFLF